MFILTSIPDSEARLWDYIIDIEFVKNPIPHGEKSILIGTVLDHAYRPVSDVNVKVMVAGESYALKTDERGEFGKQIDSSHLAPRTYSVQIIASSDNGKKSMARTTFNIEGHVGKNAVYEKQLESMKLANDPSKLRKNSNDPISIILYEHYLKLQEKSLQEKHKEELLNAPQEKIREIRQIVKDKLKQNLDERPLLTKNFNDSLKLSKFLQNLDDDTRNLFELQLNSTKLRFIDGQNIMQDILMNGGSYQEARKAYLEYMSITQEEMNSFTKNMEKSENSLKPSTNSTEN